MSTLPCPPLFRYPNELLETLRLLVLRTEDVTKTSANGSKERSDPSKIRLTKALNSENEALVYEAIVEACFVALERWVTGLSKDEIISRKVHCSSALGVAHRDLPCLGRSDIPMKKECEKTTRA